MKISPIKASLLVAATAVLTASLLSMGAQPEIPGLPAAPAAPKDEAAELRKIAEALTKRTSDLEQAVSSLSRFDPPVGTVMAYVGSLPGDRAKLEEWERQTGWMLCDGRHLAKDQNEELFKVIGACHGEEGPEFMLPDYRGLFLRGSDRGALQDPDASGRQARALGGATGDNIGSYQKDSLIRHNHDVTVNGTTEPDGAHTHEIERSKGAHQTIRWGDGGGSSSDRIDQGHDVAEGGDGAIQARSAGVHTHRFVGTGTSANNKDGGSETRPRNSSVNWIIKASSSSATPTGP